MKTTLYTDNNILKNTENLTQIGAIYGTESGYRFSMQKPKYDNKIFDLITKFQEITVKLKDVSKTYTNSVYTARIEA